MPSIAFFDLDKTVLAINSAPLVFRRLRRDGHIGRLAGIGVALDFLRYGLGLADAEDLIRTGARMSRGAVEDEVRAWYEVFWTEEVGAKVRPGARRAVEEHRRAGDATVLITSSTPYIAAIAARELGLDEAIAPRVVVENGRLTGICEEPICTGVGKIHFARRAAEARGVALEDCAFYSDSYSDLPLLEAVRRPFIVDPDPRLRRLAHARRWPIVDWDRAAR